jgi:hypothetical protein
MERECMRMRIRETKRERDIRRADRRNNEKNCKI